MSEKQENQHSGGRYVTARAKGKWKKGEGTRASIFIVWGKRGKKKVLARKKVFLLGREKEREKKSNQGK